MHRTMFCLSSLNRHLRRFNFNIVFHFLFDSQTFSSTSPSVCCACSWLCASSRSLWSSRVGHRIEMRRSEATWWCTLEAPEVRISCRVCRRRACSSSLGCRFGLQFRWEWTIDRSRPHWCRHRRRMFITKQEFLNQPPWRDRTPPTWPLQASLKSRQQARAQSNFKPLRQFLRDRNRNTSTRKSTFRNSQIRSGTTSALMAPSTQFQLQILARKMLNRYRKWPPTT